jgi:hypothetical protein
MSGISIPHRPAKNVVLCARGPAGCRVCSEAPGGALRASSVPFKPVLLTAAPGPRGFGFSMRRRGYRTPQQKRGVRAGTYVGRDARRFRRPEWVMRPEGQPGPQDPLLLARRYGRGGDWPTTRAARLNADLKHPLRFRILPHTGRGGQRKRNYGQAGKKKPRR